MHWKAMMERDYLFAFDLQGRDVAVTIEKVTAGQLVGEGGRKTKKPVCYFKGKSKPLALNSTNCKTIAALYGNDTEGWLGKRVTLYPTVTQFGGVDVECIRVRPQAPSGKADRTERTEQPEEREPGADG